MTVVLLREHFFSHGVIVVFVEVVSVLSYFSAQNIASQQRKSPFIGEQRRHCWHVDSRLTHVDSSGKVDAYARKFFCEIC